MCMEDHLYTQLSNRGSRSSRRVESKAKVNVSFEIKLLNAKYIGETASLLCFFKKPETKQF